MSYPTPPPPPKQRKQPTTNKPVSQQPDFWESNQGDGSAGTKNKKPVPGGGGPKGTYTPERD